MANFGPFFGPWMAIPCQKRSPCFDNFPNVSRDFLHFLTTLWPWFEPVLLSIFIHFPHVLLQKSTTQHSTYTLTDTHTHTHMHTCHWPFSCEWLTFVVTRGKTAKYAWKRQSQWNLWRRLVAMLTGKSFVCGEVATDQSNHLLAGSLRSFPRFQGQKRMIWGLGHALFSTYSQTLKWVRSCAYFRWTPRASDNTTWAIHGKQKSGEEEWTKHRVKVLLHMLKNPCFLDKKCEVLSRETLFHWIGPLMNERSYSVKQCFSG